MPDTEKPDDEKAEQQQSAADPAEAWGSTVAVRESEAVLPEWLDDFISEIGAFHSCGNRRYQHTEKLVRGFLHRREPFQKRALHGLAEG